MCESVSVAQSVGEEQGQPWPSKQRKRKQTLENMATDRTLLELEPACPVGTSGTTLTPGVSEWSLILPQQLINADSVGLYGQGSIYSGDMRPWTVGGQFSGPLQLISGWFCHLERSNSANFAHRNVDKVDGRGKAVKQSWLAQTRSATLQIQICIEINHPRRIRAHWSAVVNYNVHDGTHLCLHALYPGSDRRST